MRTSVFVVVAGALLAIGLVASVEGRGRGGFALSSQDKASMAEVKIDNFSFGPAALRVGLGSTVTWINRDDIPHTVGSTDDAKTFKSKVLDKDEKFSFTFTKAGTFPYFCSIHPKMTGKVIVQ